MHLLGCGRPPLGFVPLLPLALPPGHTFHSQGLCTGCTLRIVLRRVALGGFELGSALGWKAFVQGLLWASSWAFSLSLPSWRTPSTWHPLPSVPFWEPPLSPSSRLYRFWLLPRGTCWGFVFTEMCNLSTPDVPVPPGGQRSAICWDGVWVPRGLQRTAHRGSWPSLPASGRGPGGCCWTTWAFWWEASCGAGCLGHVGVSSTSDDLLSGFLAYLYTWLRCAYVVIGVV